MKTPELYSYHDHLGFLRDWLAYRKASQPGFSIRTLARESGLSAGYLPLVLAGKRTLTLKALTKLSPHLGLSKPERSYFEALVMLGTTDSQKVRLEALEKMKRFRSYQKSNPRELEAYEYLTHWYYVAIREMASLPGFEATPEWIAPRLKFGVPLHEIKSAIEFLKARGYLRNPDKSIECVGGVYKVALTQFHHELLELAARSINDTPSTERNIQGHTVALSQEQFKKASAILDEALEKIRALGQKQDDGEEPDTGGMRIFHAELALFPLTRKAGGKPS